MARKDRPTTKWWTANREDAMEIAVRFHGSYLTTDSNEEWAQEFARERNLRFEQHRQTIEDAIVGEPKKRILGIVEWVLGHEKAYNEELEMGETPEPFVASALFDGWAREHRAGKYREPQPEEFEEVSNTV